MKISEPLEILKVDTIPLLVAFVGVGGGVIGTLIGSYLTAQHQTGKDITDRRVAAYKKFFEGQAKLLESKTPDSTKEDKEKLTKEYRQEIKEARFEIGVFASPEVIQTMVNLFGVLDKQDQKDDNLWQADVKTIKRCVRTFSVTRGVKLMMQTFTICSSVAGP